MWQHLGHEGLGGGPTEGLTSRLLSVRISGAMARMVRRAAWRWSAAPLKAAEARLGAAALTARFQPASGWAGLCPMCHPRPAVTVVMTQVGTSYLPHTPSVHVGCKFTVLPTGGHHGLAPHLPAPPLLCPLGCQPLAMQGRVCVVKHCATAFRTSSNQRRLPARGHIIR